MFEREWGLGVRRYGRGMKKSELSRMVDCKVFTVGVGELKPAEAKSGTRILVYIMKKG